MMVAALEKSVASEGSEDFDASDAYEESVQKGRETTELLTVCRCMGMPTDLLWRYAFMLRCSVTGHLDLELGPQAKGNNMRVGAGSSWKPQEAIGQPVWPLQVVREAKGCPGHQLETVRCQSHGVRKPWEVHVMAYHFQRHKLHQQACKS